MAAQVGVLSSYQMRVRLFLPLRSLACFGFCFLQPGGRARGRHRHPDCLEGRQAEWDAACRRTEMLRP